MAKLPRDRMQRGSWELASPKMDPSPSVLPACSLRRLFGDGLSVSQSDSVTKEMSVVYLRRNRCEDTFLADVYDVLVYSLIPRLDTCFVHIDSVRSPSPAGRSRAHFRYKHSGTPSI